MNIPDNAIIVFTGAQLREFLRAMTERPESGNTISLRSAAVMLGMHYSKAFRLKGEIGAYRQNKAGHWVVDRKDVYAYKARMKRS